MIDSINNVVPNDSDALKLDRPVDTDLVNSGAIPGVGPGLRLALPSNVDGEHLAHA